MSDRTQDVAKNAEVASAHNANQSASFIVHFVKGRVGHSSCTETRRRRPYLVLELRGETRE